ncbi:MAG: NAD(P)H-dependent oxidoreductase [Lachnospiraceae bacterium]|nr:NAD(P)H-dependent oxidoreductase [Lachnospiraceae bacterium]
MEKYLVAYFSASGVTEKAAKKLAEAAGADLYEIKPEVLYTKADLNWMNKKSRSTIEMQDLSCRPALADADADVEGAEVVFVGFPIWWYREPSIIDTFLEAYDFNGKTIVPFATSGGSGLGESAKRMQELAGKGAKVVEGKRFSSRVSVDELKDWIKNLGL